ncbi:MAG: aminopeptidase P N-terminal domain-containing protein, partial [Myxococcota bacterium]
AVAVLRNYGDEPYTLFVEPRDRTLETWTGYRPGVEGAVDDYEADGAHPRDGFLEKIPELIRGAQQVYHVLGRNASLDARLTETVEALRLRSRAEAAPPERIVDPRSISHAMRLKKEAGEIEIMRRAAAITHEAHRAAAAMARAGTPEYALEAALEYGFRKLGASGPAYTCIVGGGANATILHYVRNDQTLSENELVLIDAGCELEGYASDVTRTYPVDGHFTGPARALYEVVLAAQEASLAECRPGATLPAIHDASVRTLSEGLVELGLLEGGVEEVVAKETYRSFYMHGTSHWLGLDVHDVGSYRGDVGPRVLEADMAFTVEPGLYVSPDAEVADERFRGIGIRIEDDVVITADGHENLNADLPKRPDDVAALVRERPATDR